jgi:hypothetical protein
MSIIYLTENAIYTALRTFLNSAVTTADIAIVRGQQNRVAQPPGSNFIVFTPLRNERLGTTQTAYVEIQFNGSIAGNVLTVAEMTWGGGILPGSVVRHRTVGTVANNTAIITQTSGTAGKVGTYTITPGGQTVALSPLYISTRFDLAPTQLTVQLDVYGPDSWANAQAIETLFRSSYGVQAIDVLSINAAPLYCDSARQIAFIDGEREYEDRWMMELALHVNPTIGTVQDAAEAIDVILVPADLL